MTDSSAPLPTTAPLASDCLGRTCLKWRDDGELTALDLGLVLSRLARVDQQLTGTPQDVRQTQPCQSISVHERI